jgi:hypothetical protein
MPAIHVEPCFITNPQEEAFLRDERFVRRLAVAIARGIERYFEGIDATDSPVPATTVAERSEQDAMTGSGDARLTN